jgi:hypothetical protein
MSALWELRFPQLFVLLMMGGGATRNMYNQFPDKINCVTFHFVGYILELEILTDCFW